MRACFFSCAILTILTFSAISHASPGVPSSVAFKTTQKPVMETGRDGSYRGGTAMMITGMTLTCAGIIGAGVANVIMIMGIYENATIDPEAPSMGGGLALIFGGIGLAAASTLAAIGAPLWVVGAKRRGRMKKNLTYVPSLSLAPILSAQKDNRGAALSMAWRF